MIIATVLICLKLSTSTFAIHYLCGPRNATLRSPICLGNVH